MTKKGVIRGTDLSLDDGDMAYSVVEQNPELDSDDLVQSGFENDEEDQEDEDEAKSYDSSE